jgi:entericidin B
MFKKLTAILMAACFAGLAGCNTMSGLGKDVQKGGASLENSAEKEAADLVGRVGAFPPARAAGESAEGMWGSVRSPPKQTFPSTVLLNCWAVSQGSAR